MPDPTHFYRIRRWPGQAIADDNQADALCLLAFAMEEVGS